MERLLRQLYEYNAASGHYKAVVAAAGCGASAISALFSVSGSSSLMLEAHVPYSKESVQDFCQQNGVSPPEKFASIEAAIKLAAASYNRAQHLIAQQSKTIADLVNPTQKDDPDASIHPVGVGVAGAVMTNRERKGEDVSFVASCSDTRLLLTGIHFPKDGRTREAQEAATRDACLDSLLTLIGEEHVNREKMEVLDLPEFTEWDFLTDPAHPSALPASKLCKQDVTRPDPLVCITDPSAQLPYLPRMTHALCLRGASETGFVVLPNPAIPHGSVILPGSFNPFHRGHEEMAVAALKLVREGPPAAADADALFELAATNADKPPLTYDTIVKRIQQFTNPMGSDLAAAGGVAGASWPLLVTNSPRFVDKAKLLKGNIFLLGYDTAKRVLETKYYDDEEAMIAALYQLKSAGVRFLVAGRLNAETGKFMTLDELRPTISPLLRSMFFALPETSYRQDISSTEIRVRAMGAASTK